MLRKTRNHKPSLHNSSESPLRRHLSIESLESRWLLTGIDFEDGTGHDVPIPADHYGNVGITISNAVWIQRTGQFHQGNYGLGVLDGDYPINDWGLPSPNKPIQLSFAHTVNELEVTAFDIGANGATVRLFNSAGSLLDEQTVFGQDIGIGNDFTFSFGISGIARVDLSLGQAPTIGDGIGWDNLSFTTDEPTFLDYIVGSVKAFGASNGPQIDVSNNREGMLLQWRPNFSANQYEVAELGGFEHFNFYQEITSVSLNGAEGPIANAIAGRGPGVDPLLGGNNTFSPADDFPWYYDEVDVPGGNPELNIDSSPFPSSQFGVTFLDHPSLCLPGPRLEFATYLAAVTETNGGSYFPFPGTGFKWAYTSTGTCSSGDVSDVTVLRNTDPSLAKSTGTIEFLGLLTEQDWNGERIARLQAAGLNGFNVPLIDVKPERDSATINLSSNGVIPVAMLGTDTFDATTVNVQTISFSGASPVRTAFEDVNGDGRLDLMLHFRTQDTALRQLYADTLAGLDQVVDGRLDPDITTRQSVTLSLTAETEDGDELVGFDNVELFLAGKALRDILGLLASSGRI